MPRIDKKKYKAAIEAEYNRMIEEAEASIQYQYAVMEIYDDEWTRTVPMGTYDSLEEAQGRLAWTWEWKEERHIAADKNEAEGFKDGNSEWFYYYHGWPKAKNPTFPIKDLTYAIYRRPKPEPWERIEDE